MEILRDTEESQVKDIERRVWTASTTAGANSKDGKEMINGCRVIEFPEVPGPCGDLTFIEGHRHIPFAIKRVFYLYNVPEDMARAKHAHKQLEQILVAISGSFVVKLDDGVNKVHLHLDKAHVGLYVPPMTWVVLEDFSAGAVCLVLASEFYYESDYHRDYDAFLKALNESDL